MRLETGAARGLIKWKRARRRMVPMAKNVLGTWVVCSNVFSTAYFVSCRRESGSESEGEDERGDADLFVELVEVVVDLVLGLDEHGVLLDLFCCGHLETE